MAGASQEFSIWEVGRELGSAGDWIRHGVKFGAGLPRPRRGARVGRPAPPQQASETASMSPHSEAPPLRGPVSPSLSGAAEAARRAGVRCPGPPRPAPQPGSEQPCPRPAGAAPTSPRASPFLCLGLAPHPRDPALGGAGSFSRTHSIWVCSRARLNHSCSAPFQGSGSSD